MATAALNPQPDRSHLRSSYQNLSENRIKSTPKSIFKGQVNTSAITQNVFSGSLHETDLFKLAVRNLTQADFSQSLSFLKPFENDPARTSADSDLKDLRLQALRLYFKVWSGYSKYLKSQIDKGRVVVCPIIGTFLPGDVLKDQQVAQLNPEDFYQDQIHAVSSSNLVYYIPSLELLENLKLTFNEEKFGNLNPYFNIVKQYFQLIISFQKGSNFQLVRVSFGSIGQVCDNISEGATIFIIKSIVNSIDTALKRDLNVKLNLKVGFLKFNDQSVHFEQELRSNIVYRNFNSNQNGKNNRNGGMMQQDNDYMSMKGQPNRAGLESGGSFSLRSKLNMSLITPNTYSQRHSQNVSTANSVERVKFINMSNPNPQNGNRQYGKLTYSQIQDINKQNGVTIQGFPGIFQNGVQYRFGKKICFDQIPTQKDVLVTQLDQMNYKKNQHKSEFNEFRSSEQQLLSEIKQQLIQEKRQKYELLMGLRKDFISENSKRRQEKMDRDHQEKKDKIDYKINFFPFTHGEQVEQKRILQRADQKEDLKQYLTQTSQQHTKRGREGNNQWLDSSYSTQFHNSLNGKVSTDYLTSYPQFLKPNKFYPHRRTDDSHLKNAMELALEKYEKDLIEQENTKKQHIHNQMNAIEKDLKQVKDQEMRKELLKQQHKSYLEIQMQEKRFKKDKEHSQKKEKVNTHFGPEETDQIAQKHIEKIQDSKQAMEQELKRQMQEKKLQKERLKEFERLEELQQLATAGEILMNERENLKQKEQLQKQLYKSTWQQQMKIKQQEKVINNELLTGDKSKQQK